MTTMVEDTRTATGPGGGTDAVAAVRTGTESIQELIRRTIEGMQARQVYGEPIERDGALFVPAAKVRGGGGSGGDTEGNGGGGFGLTARPAGMFVIRDGTTTWQPALDLNRVILGGQIVAIVALLVLRSILKRRS
jgi:uncharacterized spore protein YtfJ